MRHQNILVTTTSNLDGIKINEYIKPVTAHVVVGMNIFKDMFAGLSDIFGGNSSTYEKTLSSINNTVLNKLKEEAFSLGANCILSLKIDNDEVSAQGKSMMMVTAIGTAAKADFKDDTNDLISGNRPERINSDLLKMLSQRQEYLDLIEAKKYISLDSILTFGTKYQVGEFASFITDKMMEILQDINTHDAKERSKKFYQYFSIIDSELSISILYPRINSNTTVKLRLIIVEMIKELKLVNYEWINKMLQSEDNQTRKCFVEIATFDKESFNKEDIALIHKSVLILQETFRPKVVPLKRTSKLFGKEMDLWVCECEKENDIEKIYCAKCKKDNYGFYENELNPLKAQELLMFKAKVLNGYFSSKS